MYLTENIKLVRTLLDQLSADVEMNSEELAGDRDRILFGLREMLRLNLISGAHQYSEYSDPTGPLLSSVSCIRLTRRGVVMKRP